MKHEKQLTALTAAVLAFAAGWGTLGCLTSGLGLPVEAPVALALICGGASILWALLCSLPHGGTAALCLLALGAGYAYHDGRAARQFLHFLHHLSVIYDRAYGWGVLLPELAGEVDAFLGILGGIIALTVCWSVCARKTVWLPVLATILPLCSCIVVTDTVPGELWLLLVLFSLILLILSTSVRRENAAQGLRLMIGGAVPVLVGLILLFLAVPQKNYVNHSKKIQEQILSTARSVPRVLETGMMELASRLPVSPPRQVDLAQLGERIPLQYAVMEVTAGESGTLYLREQDYDSYDGLGWMASSDRQEVFSQSGGRAETIIIRCVGDKAVQFLPYYPAEETILTGGGAKASENWYTIRRTHLPEDWRQTAYGNPQTLPEGMERYLALPENTGKAGSQLLEGLFQPGASNTEKADILAAFVTNSAKYDLNPSKMPAGEGDFALWFLREGETGYCVHFATAATVLLRAAGIPARYVTGYMLEAAAGQKVTVTEENAHAWAEYYEPNLGLWLPLEVTPAQQEAEAVVTAPTAPQTTQTPETEATETLPEPVTQPPVETTLATETAPVETLPEPLPESPVTEKTPSFPVWLVAVPMLALLMSVQRSVRLTLRRKRLRRGCANAQAIARWQEAERLCRLLKEKPDPELLALAQKAKFSQHDLTAEELQTFDSFCRGCLRRLREKPWYLQGIYRYIYAIY